MTVGLFGAPHADKPFVRMLAIHDSDAEGECEEEGRDHSSDPPSGCSRTWEVPVEHEVVPSALIVTGAGRGIGLAIVRATMSRALHVYGLDIHVPADVPRGDQSSSWHDVDVADEQQVRSFFADHVKPGSVGGLVNCAGAVERTSIIDADVAEWERMLAVNLSSAFLVIREFVAYAALPAAIVNVSSVNAHYGHPERLGYAVAKGGVEALTRVTARQLAGRGIRVNTVVPGAIATPDDPRQGRRSPLPPRALR
ncbi:SDR family NAD(P)-dependent oxidoreductase [Micromonospora noduli]|uniref:SDR family NAD(P)-dependent oxidoreductase n=1 Tax=Micromonospora noduli TaxID=709876 RepID=UPI0024B0001E|nr:SDR family oxidoreductase [Micromonospora noduli]